MDKKDQKKGDLTTLEEIEALDDQEVFDDSFIEELSPALSEEDKVSNLNLVEKELEELSEGSNIPGDVDGVIEKIFTFEEEEEPAWANFDDAKVKASIDAGEIFPELKPRKNAKYHAILLTLPKEVKSDKGDFFVVEIEVDGMRQSLKANRSFNFNLKRYKVMNKLRYADLIGRKIVFQKDEEGYMVVQFK